jgi:hypothetical protein
MYSISTVTVWDGAMVPREVVKTPGGLLEAGWLIAGDDRVEVNTG